MQTKKDTIRQSVLAVAREEFFEKGYKDTNMRTIAQKAGVGLGNIYNYFKSKDELFNHVLRPAIRALQELTEEHNSNANLNIGIFESQEYITIKTNLFLRVVLEFKEELRILLFESHGSSLEDFKEQYIDQNTEMSLEYLRLMKERNPHINIDISYFFVHTVSAWWISIMGELVMHDLERDELECFVSEYIEYVTAGWQKIMRVE